MNEVTKKIKNWNVNFYYIFFIFGSPICFEGTDFFASFRYYLRHINERMIAMLDMILQRITFRFTSSSFCMLTQLL
jgi:hypothetical protein